MRRVLAVAVAVGLAPASCAGPSLAECVDRVDPELRELGLLPEQPESLELTVDPNLRVMTVNVGNGDEDGRYALRLSYQAYEDHIGQQIRELAPDIVGLQEILPRATCLPAGEEWESDPDRTCHAAASRPDQVRRLLGDGYSIVCESLRQVDCLGVRVGFAAIEGLAPGAYSTFWAGTSPLPAGFGLCDYLDEECREKLPVCDAESSVMQARLRTADGTPIQVVHIHPSAFGQACREHQLAEAFSLLRAAREADPEVELLMLGDWNMDPDRLNRPAEEALYYTNVGPGRLVREHDERTAECARVPTGPFDLASLDRVVTSFAQGFCSVQHESHVPVGEDRPRGRLDADFGQWEAFPDGREDEGRMDHSAVVCDLFWPALGG